ncbi:SRPBCC family protein [Parafrankia discariae]|uniref:hypothetical protein n=1 Tax=Parafrankia discariae TaxID=365528 RepID=UPI000368B969|nr:hypothetical protein [Parafrankia discariae]
MSAPRRDARSLGGALEKSAASTRSGRTPYSQSGVRDTDDLADADGGGTDVTVRHEGIPDGVPVADNEAGTRMALAGLAAFLEAGRPAG